MASLKEKGIKSATCMGLPTLAGTLTGLGASKLNKSIAKEADSSLAYVKYQASPERVKDKIENTGKDIKDLVKKSIDNFRGKHIALEDTIAVTEQPNIPTEDYFQSRANQYSNDIIGVFTLAGLGIGLYDFARRRLKNAYNSLVDWN